MAEIPLRKTELSEASLFRQKRFLYLWAATIFSAFSRTMFMFSQAWYVVRILDLEASIAFIFIATSIPTVVFMLIGGVAADRVSRSKIMFFSEATRSLLVAGLAVLLLFFDPVGLWVFVVFALVFGVLNAFFAPARDSLVPSLVNEQQLTRANSLIQTTTQLSSVFGPVLAGVAIVWGGYPFVFAITAFALAAGSVFALLVKASAAGDAMATASEPPQNIGRSIMQGIRVIRGSAFLTAEFVISVVVNMVFAGPVMVGLPLFVDEILSGDTLDYSYIEGSLSFGMVIGAVVMGIINLKRKRGNFAMLSLIGLSLAFLCFSQSGSVWQAMMLIFVLGMLMQGTNIPLIAAIQSMVERKMIGRVMSLLSISALGLTPVSFALTSVLLSLGVKVDTIMTASAVPMLLIALYIYWRVPVMRKMD